jgi:phenylalanyl-tRNA synthetase alpha chain
MNIEIESSEEARFKKFLEKRDDPEAKRLLRFLHMPDLTRVCGSPLHDLVERIVHIKRFSEFDMIRVPDVVSTDICFDLFNFPSDHPARSASDTYFVDRDHILRTHTTIMWYYYLNHESIKEKIKNKESVGALSYGKVYRKDEIDRNHMNIFHQMDGWYLAPKVKEKITVDDLKKVLAEIAQTIFGKDIPFRFNEDKFPYTDPSIEMEIEIGLSTSSGQARWVEVLGAGVVRGAVLKNLGVDPDEYNGWAFGFGLERLAIISMDLPDIRLLWSQDPRIARQLKLGQKYVPVSKYPPITRDISFVVPDTFVPNNYFDLLRDLGGDLVEEVQLIDTYQDEEKFGAGRSSYTYRIVFRSNDRTLTSSEIDEIMKTLYQETAKQFNAELR